MITETFSKSDRWANAFHSFSVTVMFSNLWLNVCLTSSTDQRPVSLVSRKMLCVFAPFGCLHLFSARCARIDDCLAYSPTDWLTDGPGFLFACLPRRSLQLSEIGSRSNTEDLKNEQLLDSMRIHFTESPLRDPLVDLFSSRESTDSLILDFFFSVDLGARKIVVSCIVGSRGEKFDIVGVKLRKWFPILRFFQLLLHSSFLDRNFLFIKVPSLDVDAQVRCLIP